MNAKRSKTRRRPFGVTVLAILQTVSGIQLLYGAIAFFLAALIVATPEGREYVSSFVDEDLIPSLPPIFAIVGIILLAISILSFHLARGYVNGHEWARRRGRKVAAFAILKERSKGGGVRDSYRRDKHDTDPSQGRPRSPSLDDTVEHIHTGISQPEACEEVLQVNTRIHLPFTNSV